MKKLYEEPECEFVLFNESDVMTYSIYCADPEDPVYWEAVGGYADSDICFIGEFTDPNDQLCEED